VIIYREDYEPKAVYPFIIRRWFNKDEAGKGEMKNKKHKRKIRK